MRHFLLFATCTVWLGAAQDLPNTLTPKESVDGWKLLFDGKTLHGWESHWAEDWTARDGELVCSAAERSWLSTSDSFSDYLFKVEFRGAGSVNSGVFLRSEKEGQPHITGYELQIWDYQPAGKKKFFQLPSIDTRNVESNLDDFFEERITLARGNRLQRPNDCASLGKNQIDDVRKISIRLYQLEQQTNLIMRQTINIIEHHKNRSR